MSAKQLGTIIIGDIQKTIASLEMDRNDARLKKDIILQNAKLEIAFLDGKIDMAEKLLDILRKMASESEPININGIMAGIDGRD